MCSSLLFIPAIASLPPPVCGKSLLFLISCVFCGMEWIIQEAEYCLCWCRASQLELDDIILESLEVNKDLTVPSFCHRTVSFLYLPKSVSSCCICQSEFYRHFLLYMFISHSNFMFVFDYHLLHTYNCSYSSKGVNPQFTLFKEY